jgi:tetratricopeptide (TPR) repeat protein
MLSFFARPPTARATVVAPLLLLAVLGELYLLFLNNPLVFDDFNFFTESNHAEIMGQWFSFELRWLPNVTFELPRRLFSGDLPLQRAINLCFHAANALLLAGLLRRLLAVALPPRAPDAATIAPYWIAFFAASIFALHPAAVYAVAYLVQRTSLMALFFTLLSWRWLLDGALADGAPRGRVRLLLSAAAYCMAVLCKEHAIMAPAVGAAMLLVAHRERAFSRGTWLALAGTYFLYLLAALHVVWRIKSSNILGTAYQANGLAMLAEYARRDPSFDPARAFPLSVLTQVGLFFKYLWLWALPNPGAMSIDMNAAFALHAAPWRIAAACAFVLWPVASLWLLLRRGSTALFGLALLSPWLMFMTEISTVRVQEIFVLYRSYLWMPLATLAVPLLALRLPPRAGALVPLAFVCALVPGALDRLHVMSDDWLLWNDAARLVEQGVEHQGAERIFKNRGLAALNRKRYDEALRDNSIAIGMAPTDFIARNNRGVTYYEMGRYQDAVRDFSKALELYPEYANSYLGRGRTLEKLGNQAAAQSDFDHACKFGIPQLCGSVARVGGN